MFGYAVVLYAALACLTVKPEEAVYPVEARAVVPVVPVGGQPGQLPAKPSLPVVCKQLNEMGVQKHPSLNP